MQTRFYTFKVADLINTYTQKLLTQQGNNSNPKDKAQYETVLFEMETKQKTLVNNREYNKEFFLNLDILINNLITENNIKNGFAVCSSGSPTASIYINHFEKGAMTDLSKALRKKYSKLKGKGLIHFLKSKTEEQEEDGENKLIPTAKATAIGRTALVLIIEGKLSLGKFDNVVYAEFDYDANATFTVALYSDVK